MPDTNIEVKRSGDLVPLIVGGILVWLYYWWKAKGGTLASACANAAMPSTCCATSAPAPEVIPDNDVNATSGRFMEATPGSGTPPPEINYYGQLVEPGASGLPTGRYVQSASYLEG
jgi:hypothetical protein